MIFSRDRSQLITMIIFAASLVSYAGSNLRQLTTRSIQLTTVLEPPRHDSRPRRKDVDHLCGVPLREEPIIRFAYQPIRGPDDVQVCIKVVRILRKFCAQRVNRAVRDVELGARAFLVAPEYLVERLWVESFGKFIDEFFGKPRKERTARSPSRRRTWFCNRDAGL